MSLALRGAGGSGSSASVVVLQDSFTDVDTTALTAHVMEVGAGWSKVLRTGAFTGTIVTNRGLHTQGAAGGTGWHRADSGAANQVGSVVAQCSLADASMDVLVRESDLDNCWAFVLSAALDSFRLFELNAGTFTLRASAAVTVGVATDFTISWVLSGQSIIGRVDGANEISFGSASHNLAATGVGLGCLNTQALGVSSYNNLLVSA